MRYSRGRLLRLVAAIAAVALLALAGCGGDDDGGAASDGATADAASESIAAFRDDGVRVAISNEPPYATLEPGGEPAGIDPELARAALETQGVTEFNATVTDFDAMIPGLQAGQWDMVATGLLVYPERCEQVLFSDPTIADIEVAIVPEGNPKGIEGYEMMAGDSSIRFAVIRGTTYDTKAREFGLAQSQLVAVPDTLNGVAAVRAGRADIHTALRQSAEALREQGSLEGLEIIPVAEAETQLSAVAFSRDDGALRDAFNRGLEAIKEDGTFDEITREWGFDPELSKGATLADAGPACAEN